MKILFPPEHRVMICGTYHVIVKGEAGELKVDGQPQPWEDFAEPIHVARLGLSPGIHTVEVAGRKIDFAVGMNADEHDGPKDWEFFRCHQIKPDEKRCGWCHQTTVQDGKMAVGQPRGAEACFECHQPAEWEAKHKPATQSDARCTNCHSLHGSSRKGLLKPDVK